MGSIITVSIKGYVGSEPQLRQVGEQRVASFSVAINRTTGNGNQQASIDIDANRLILLDRVNGENSEAPEDETIPF